MLGEGDVDSVTTDWLYVNVCDDSAAAARRQLDVVALLRLSLLCRRFRDLLLLGSTSLWFDRLAGPDASLQAAAWPACKNRFSKSSYGAGSKFHGAVKTIAASRNPPAATSSHRAVAIFALRQGLRNIVPYTSKCRSGILIAEQDPRSSPWVWVDLDSGRIRTTTLVVEQLPNPLARPELTANLLHPSTEVQGVPSSALTIVAFGCFEYVTAFVSRGLWSWRAFVAGVFVA
ncbi:hypothetical protein DFJ73DRAFT_774337 [Zopfochytrium polystomum]|nr:hypothetical protein DFJ73DRAFT_774337 [Zopfochytrium polystomum]